MNKIKKLKLNKRLLLGMITLASSLTFGSFNTINVEAGGKIENSQDDMKTAKDYITYYSSVFNLEGYIIYDYFKEKTRNFTAYEWEHFNYINGKSYDNQELAILLTIRDIYYHPEKHGFENIEDIKTSDLPVEPTRLKHIIP